ncbi:hypothetical protein ACIG5E_03315 [Kitasatospora sp. NPDC053057]|uniref:hypothetical protein n=1 Tax=Kitasatospora sp. NPDC053057 TaxID=3364062 RepID=UPI0037C81617
MPGAPTMRQASGEEVDSLARGNTRGDGLSGPVAQLRRPVVAVVGSSPAGSAQTADGGVSAARAAEEIGAALAAQGCDLMVYSSSPAFLEHHVVTGYLAGAPVAARSIRVRPPFDHPRIDFAEMEQHEKAFEVRHEAGADWEVAFYRSLSEVQGIVLIGGGRTTLVTAMVGLAFEIPLAPVAAFGGGARKAWETLGRVRNQATEEEISDLGAGWRPGSGQRVVGVLLEQHRRRLAQQRQREQGRRSKARHATLGLLVGTVMLLAALATIPLTYATTASASLNLTALILGSLLAATSGAITRTSVDRGGDWYRASALGLAAGAVAFLLFVTAQLATSPDILVGSGARRLLFFVVSVGFIAGFTSDAVYAKLRQQDVLDMSALSAAVTATATTEEEPGEH